MQAQAEHRPIFMVLPPDKWGPDHLGVFEWVGGLGHCKQAQRKGRFILLEVSWEGIKWKVPWSSRLVTPQDAPGRHHGEGAMHVQGVTATLAGGGSDAGCCRWPGAGRSQGWRHGGAWSSNSDEPCAGSLNLPPLIFQKKKRLPSLVVLAFLRGFYRERNTLLFQSRMPSVYWVLVFCLCLKKLDYNEQGIFVFYGESKSHWKSMFKKIVFGKRGGGNPKEKQENCKSLSL